MSEQFCDLITLINNQKDTWFGKNAQKTCDAILDLDSNIFLLQNIIDDNDRVAAMIVLKKVDYVNLIKKSFFRNPEGRKKALQLFSEICKTLFK